MATPFRLKRSAVSGKRPELSDLQKGELALNFYDGHLFAERDTGGVGIGTTITNLTPWTENFGGDSIYYSNSVGVGTETPRAKFDVDGSLNVSGITTTILLDVGVGGTVITTTETGLVGINSSTPTTTLDVGGTINSSTDVTINGTSVLSTASNDAVALAIALG